MLNLHELEQRWLRYKIKSYLPYIAIFLSLAVILSTLSIFFQEPMIVKAKKIVPVKPKIVEQQEVPKEKILIKKVAPKSVQKVIIEEVPRKKAQHEEQITLSPSLGFMKRMQTDLQPYYRKEQSSAQTQSPRHFQKELTLPEENNIADITVDKQEQKQVNTIKHISIKRENTANDISEILQRFKKNNNPALSLFVAKKYYELGNYRLARNYALITNNINQGIDASWLIFAKSLVKLGKKDKAIQILKEYIGSSHSSSAKILLDEIRSGKFI